MAHYDIDYYLDALKKYSIDYGPQPQGGDGAERQNYQVRSSGEAPGYGYVNPETNKLFPFQGQPENSTAGGFEGYIHSLGATQKPFRYNSRPDMSNPEYLASDRVGYGDNYAYSQPNFAIGQTNLGMRAGSEWALSQRGIENPSNLYGNRFGNAYVDKSGGFMGFKDQMQKQYQDRLVQSMQKVEGT